MHSFNNIENQRILLSFLNWGKGHLSRCIDVCRRLERQGNTILIACEEDDFTILNSYIPTVECLPFPGYPFSFQGTGDFAKDIWKSRKALSDFMRWEQNEVERLVIHYQITCIVSDHRYGFFSKTIPSVFMTHQINLPINWWQQPAQWLHNKWMRKFSFIWIMDDEKNSLAGKLSRKGSLKNAAYIGHFSRFEKQDNEKTIELGVCNGPHPYNQQLLEQLIGNKGLDVIISSISGNDSRIVHPGSWKETDALFYNAATIHSYCGYSTLMDLKRLGCKGKLIPTPGQTEQEYLHLLHPNFDFSESSGNVFL